MKKTNDWIKRCMIVTGNYSNEKVKWNMEIIEIIEKT